MRTPTWQQAGTQCWSSRWLAWSTDVRCGLCGWLLGCLHVERRCADSEHATLPCEFNHQLQTPPAPPVTRVSNSLVGTRSHSRVVALLQPNSSHGVLLTTTDTGQHHATCGRGTVGEEMMIDRRHVRTSSNATCDVVCWYSSSGRHDGWLP